jgi:hypothetical protein
MEHIYNFKGNRMTLNEFKEDIINDYINTKKTKKELRKIYPISTITLSKVLKNVKKKYCECLKCGNIVFPRFQTIQQRKGGGCSTCAVRGITLTEPAYFYVIKHDRMGALKVGIGNPSSVPDRIKSYLNKDWILLRKYDFPTGIKAERLESKVLKWIRKDLGLQPYLSRQVLRNGHTETADLNEIDLSNLYERIDNLIAKGLRK